MKQISIELEKRLTKLQKEEFENKIFYISENIQSFDYNVDNNCYVLHFKTCINQNETYDLNTHIKRILKQDIYRLKDIANKRIWEYPCDIKNNNEELIQKLINKRWLYVPLKGQVSISSPVVELLEFFDTLLCKLAMHFNAKKYYFPTLLSYKTIEKAGYFDSFPNRLFFVNRMKNEIDNYTLFQKQFCDNINKNGYLKEIRKYQCSTEYCLPPTMCYYFYESFQEQEISNMTVTTRGRSFRYENEYTQDFSRLFDFTIRETVFLGSYNYVKDCLTTYRKMLCTLIKKLDLGGYCETANDPFFLVENSADLINSQKIFGSKYELRLYTDSGKTIAVSSINDHGQYISKRFNLYESINNKKYIYTGCTGTGLERLVYSFLCQYGVEKDNWPDCIASFIDGNDITDKIIEDVVYASSKE